MYNITIYSNIYLIYCFYIIYRLHITGNYPTLYYIPLGIRG